MVINNRADYEKFYMLVLWLIVSETALGLAVWHERIGLPLDVVLQMTAYNGQILRIF